MSPVRVTLGVTPEAEARNELIQILVRSISEISHETDHVIHCGPIAQLENVADQKVNFEELRSHCPGKAPERRKRRPAGSRVGA